MISIIIPTLNEKDNVIPTYKLLNKILHKLNTNFEIIFVDDRSTDGTVQIIENLIKLKIVQGGMIPKIKNCIDAVENGVRGVVILDGRKPHSILNEIFSDKGAGTLIRK